MRFRAALIEAAYVWVGTYDEPGTSCEHGGGHCGIAIIFFDNLILTLYSGA